MKIEISKIMVAERIRKQSVNIEELAADIEMNGLLNPVTVMAVGGGEFQLLAGLRRIMAAQLLGWTEIEVNVVSPADAEAALHIEISENEQREPFTFSEKMAYAQLLEIIEQEKAKKRMAIGKKSELFGTAEFGHRGERRDAIGARIAMSGRQYDRAKYIADHAPQSVIDALDSGKRTIRDAFEGLREAEKKSKNAGVPQQKTARKSTDASGMADSPSLSATAAQSKQAAPATHAAHESDLDRALRAERELAALKDQHLKEIIRRENTIDKLKLRVARVEKELAAANARFRALVAGTN